MAIPPLKRTSGDSITAELWNSMVDRLTDLEIGEGGSGSAMSRVIVKVKNNSGADLDVGQLLRIDNYDGPTPPLEVPTGLVLEGVDPLPGNPPQELVLAAESIPDGEIGRCVIWGLAIAKVKWDDSGGTKPRHRGISIDPNAVRTPITTEAGFASIVFEIGDTPPHDHVLVIIGVGIGGIPSLFVDVNDTSAGGPDFFKVTATGSINAPFDTPEFEIDLSNVDVNPLYDLPMIPTATGFSFTERDGLILGWDQSTGDWQRIGVTKHIAKFVHGSFTVPAGSSGPIDVTITVDDHWDGYDPGSSVPGKIILPVTSGGSGNTDYTTEGVGSFDREGLTYRILSTAGGCDEIKAQFVACNMCEFICEVCDSFATELGICPPPPACPLGDLSSGVSVILSGFISCVDGDANCNNQVRDKTPWNGTFEFVWPDDKDPLIEEATMIFPRINLPDWIDCGSGFCDQANNWMEVEILLRCSTIGTDPETYTLGYEVTIRFGTGQEDFIQDDVDQTISPFGGSFGCCNGNQLDPGTYDIAITKI